MLIVAGENPRPLALTDSPVCGVCLNSLLTSPNPYKKSSNLK